MITYDKKKSQKQRNTAPTQARAQTIFYMYYTILPAPVINHPLQDKITPKRQRIQRVMQLNPILLYSELYTTKCTMY